MKEKEVWLIIRTLIMCWNVNVLLRKGIINKPKMRINYWNLINLHKKCKWLKTTFIFLVNIFNYPNSQTLYDVLKEYCLWKIFSFSQYSIAFNKVRWKGMQTDVAESRDYLFTVLAWLHVFLCRGISKIVGFLLITSGQNVDSTRHQCILIMGNIFTSIYMCWMFFVSSIIII